MVERNKTEEIFDGFCINLWKIEKTYTACL